MARDIGGRILVDRLIRSEKVCILLLCVAEKAEDGMARIDGTICLGFPGCVKIQVAGHGPGKKLEEQRERLQQEQRKTQDQQEALAEKLAVVHSQINLGIISQLAEGVYNSSIVPNAPTTADTGVGNVQTATRRRPPKFLL